MVASISCRIMRIHAFMLLSRNISMIDIGSEVIDVPNEGDPGDVNVNVDLDPSTEGGSIDVN